MDFNKALSEMTPAELEVYRETLEKELGLSKSLRALMANEDFKAVFTELYCKDTPIRLVGLLGDVSVCKDPAMRNNVEERMIGIAQFQTFLREVIQMGYKAEYDLHKLDHMGEEEEDTTPTLRLV